MIGRLGVAGAVRNGTVANFAGPHVRTCCVVVARVNGRHIDGFARVLIMTAHR